MPGLVTTLGLDATQYKAGLDKSVSQAKTAGDRIMASLGAGGRGTVLQADASTAATRYSDWWGKTLLARDIENASRSNQARRLLRERAARREATEAAAQATAQQNAIDASVEAASRSNQARRLRRQRAEAKTAESEASSSAKMSLVSRAAGPLMAFFGARAIYSQVQETAAWGEALQDTAERLGVTTDFIQGFQSASAKLTFNFEKATTALDFLNRKIGQAKMGSDDAQQSFSKWGINIDRKSTQEVFYQIVDKLKETSDPAKRAALAFDTMGKSARELSAELAVGSTELQKIIDGASKLSENQINKLTVLEEKLAVVGLKWRQFWGALVTAYVPTPTKGISEDEIALRQQQLFLEQPGFGSLRTRKHLDMFRDEAIMQLRREQEEMDKRQADAMEKSEAQKKKEAAAKEKEKREAEAQAKRMLTARMELYREQESNDLKELTRDKQINELLERRLTILRLLATGKMSEEGRVNAATDLEKIRGELLGLRKGDKMTQMDANSLQRVGAYISNPITSRQLSMAEQTATHTRITVEKLNELIRLSGGSRTSQKGVSY